MVSRERMLMFNNVTRLLTVVVDQPMQPGARTALCVVAVAMLLDHHDGDPLCAPVSIVDDWMRLPAGTGERLLDGVPGVTVEDGEVWFDAEPVGLATGAMSMTYRLINRHAHRLPFFVADGLLCLALASPSRVAKTVGIEHRFDVRAERWELDLTETVAALRTLSITPSMPTCEWLLPRWLDARIETTFAERDRV